MLKEKKTKREMEKYKNIKIQQHETHLKPERGLVIPAPD
jgi:hypothetical protein